MQPFFFGTGEHRLFGVYHQPSGNMVPSQSIVLCHSVGHEHLHTYRIVRKLGEQLAKIGHHVLRFDFYGTGDSAGEHQDGNLNVWMGDILTAVKELQHRSGHSSISLIGFSIGAILAWAAADELPSVENLVLWRPVVSGQKWIQQLCASNQNGTSGAATSPENNSELNGFLYSFRCIRDLQTIDLLTQTMPKYGTIHMVSYPLESSETIKKVIQNSGRGGTLIQIDGQSGHPESQPILDCVVIGSPAIPHICGIFNRNT